MYIKDTSGNMVGELRGDEVFTPGGSRVGQFRGDDFYTANGSRIGQLRGSDVYTVSGERIGELRGNEIYSASGSRIGWVDGSPSNIQLGAAAVALLSGLLAGDSDSGDVPAGSGGGGGSGCGCLGIFIKIVGALFRFFWKSNLGGKIGVIIGAVLALTTLFSSNPGNVILFLPLSVVMFGGIGAIIGKIVIAIRGKSQR